MKVTVVGGFGVSKTVTLQRVAEARDAVTGGVFTQGPGGKGSNQPVQIARLGGEGTGLSTLTTQDSSQKCLKKILPAMAPLLS
jgi:ribokinase